MKIGKEKKSSKIEYSKNGVNYVSVSSVMKNLKNFIENEGCIINEHLDFEYIGKDPLSKEQNKNIIKE